MYCENSSLAYGMLPTKGVISELRQYLSITFGIIELFILSRRSIIPDMSRMKFVVARVLVYLSTPSITQKGLTCEDIT